MLVERLSRRLHLEDARFALTLLPEAKRRKLLWLCAIQFVLGMSDLIAISLVGALGAVAVAGVESQHVGGLTGRFFSAIGIGGWQAKQQVALLGGAAAVMLLARTGGSIWLTRKALHFLAVRAADASADLASRILTQPLTYIQSRSSADFQYAVTVGVTSLIVGLVGTLVTMLADAAMLVALALLLLITSPIVSMLLLALLGVMGVVLQRFTTGRAAILGQASAEADIASRSTLVEALATYRDAMVRGSRPRYASNLRKVRARSAWVSAENAFLPNVSKYVMENAVILSAILVGGAQMLIKGATGAATTLAIFLAAGTRLAPAIIRLQQGSFTLMSNAGQAQPALSLIRELEAIREPHDEPASFTTMHDGFTPTIEIADVSFQYPSAEVPALQGWSLNAEAGTMVALVGPSGAGKSTAADLLIGALSPAVGSIQISGLAPSEAVQRWPGAIAYVPQDTWIVDGTVRDNVALGFDVADVPDDAIWDALRVAELGEFVRGLPDGLDAVVGERGARMSGGQRQRLGIARAALTQPRLLVLDEATSALDAETEHAVTEALRAMRGRVTVVVIAHRLATVRTADLVQYLEDAQVRFQGTFTEVRDAVPAFERQAALLGL